MKNKEIYQCASDYIDLGFSIIPIGKDKTPLISWKHYQSVRATKDQVAQWLTQFPEMNIGVVTGKISGIVVLDIDAKHGRSSSEFRIPPTVSTISGGGGEHFYFKHPNWYVPSTNGKIYGNGVDIKGDGGYIVLPPSLHSSGNNYRWTLEPSNNDFAEIPDWLKSAILKKIKVEEKLLDKGFGGVPEGQRNTTAISIACKLRKSLPVDELETTGLSKFIEWNNKNLPPLPISELNIIWESSKKYDSKNTKKDSNVIANSLLEEIINREDVILFHDELDEAYISLEINGHQEVWPCKSKAMKRLLSSKYWDRQAKPLGSESTKSMMAVLEGKACFDGSPIKLHNRVAWHDESLWYDLTNGKWQAIRIGKEGWEIIDHPPILFKRFKHHQYQLTPAQNGNIDLFLNYVNITNSDQRLLLLVFLISCFIPDFPHVMLVIYGAQGSSKSTLSKLTRLVIDPSTIEVVSLPDNQKELVQTLAHHHFLFFDNISYVSEDASDTLCKAITGSGFSKRELYENDEDIIYKIQRCIGINGINLVTIRADLLERSLLLELERIDQNNRKTEKELYENFRNDLPQIIGGVFDVLVKAINIKPSISVQSLPRMADFAEWGCAIAQALGYSNEAFLRAYENNIGRQTEMLVNENIVASTLFTFMEGKDEWKDSVTELLKKLTEIAEFEGINTKNDKSWPKAGNILSRRLNELSTSLKKMGLSTTISTSGKSRWVHLQKIKEADQQKVETSESDGSDDTDDTFVASGVSSSGHMMIK